MVTPVGSSNYQPDSYADPADDSGGAKQKAGEVAGAAQDQAAAVAGTAKDQATAVAGTAKDQATAVAGTAKEQVSQVAGTASEQARSLLSEAQTELGSQAATQKDRAVIGLRSLSEDLGSMAGHASEGGLAGHAASEAARRGHALADYLEEREPGHLLEDLRELGRRRTGAFLLGAAALGFASGRLVKGARADAPESAPGTATQAPQGATATPPPAAAYTSPLATPDDGLDGYPAATGFGAGPAESSLPATPGEQFGALARSPHLIAPTDV